MSKRIDWEAIEADYRVGQLTVRQLEQKYKVGNATIVRHMKKHGVVRVRDQVRSRAIEIAVERVAAEAASSFEEVVRQAAEAGLMGDPTCLYRHFSANGRLLYVGVSLSVLARTSQHMLNSSWARHISRIEVEWFESRGEALAAEAIAIASEDPYYNKQRPRETTDAC